MNTGAMRHLIADRASAGPEARVVRLLGARGVLSPSEIAKATGLARSTISGVLAELRRSGMVVETETPTGRRAVGRPSTAFKLNPEAGTCVGLHLGPEALRFIVADVSHSVIFEETLELGLDYSPKAAAQAARAAVKRAYKRNGLPPRGLLGVGVSVSGPVAPDGRVQRASMVPTWAGVNIRDVFGPALDQPIFADNESNCAAIAEMTWGAAVGHEDFVLFKHDLGVGGAIVVRGRVVTGAAGGAGEFGHMTIDPEGGLCRCGNRGCLELSASFAPVLEIAARRFKRILTIDDLIALARRGDVGAERLIADAAQRAGRGLGVIGTLLNPPLFVIAGRGALAGDLLLRPLMESYERHTLIRRGDVPDALAPKFALGHFIENDSLMGAVGLVLRHHGRLG